MNFNRFGKTLLAMTLATTMALSAPMSVFAAQTKITADEKTVWTSFTKEVTKFLVEAKSNAELLEDLNKLREGKPSRFDTLYTFLSPEAKAVLENDYKLSLAVLGNVINLMTDDKELTNAHLVTEDLIVKLEAKEAKIEEKLGNRGLTLKQVTAKVKQFNSLIDFLEGDLLNFAFLKEAEGTFTVGNEAKLEKLIEKAKEQAGTNKLMDLITKESVRRYIEKFNDVASPAMKKDVLGLMTQYNLMVKEVVVPPADKDDSPSTPSTDGGATPTSPSKEAEKNITANVDKLTQKDAKVADITKEMLKDIDKLDAKAAKAAAAPIIKAMTSVMKDAKDPASIKAAQDAIVTLVQALVSRVTTQEVSVKDGKAVLSASKVKEQIKDAEAMIKQLTDEVTKSGTQLTKTPKITLSFEVDKTVADVGVSIPAGLWETIGNKANIAVKAKGVELTLERNTFTEEAYTINIEEKDGIVELTTDGTFAQPITVAFSVDTKLASYPSVYQLIEDKEELIGGTYDPATGTIKVALKHFSFYTVKESSPKMFKDISGLTWEKKAVNELSARGYIAGMTENEFMPNANTTRAEFAAMLTRVMPVNESEETLAFKDLKQDAWYYTSIATAVNQGWLVGRDNNTFDPSAPVTRAEVASVLSRVLEQRGYLQTEAAEEGVNVAAWAKDAVRLYLREVETKEVLELDMSQAATRAELAVMINEVLAK